jgi:hypothetical protein
MCRCLFVVCIVALLSSCAPHAGIDSPGALPALERTPVHEASRSWVSAGAAKWDLLYVTNANGVVNVYRYWQHKLLGVLADFKTPQGECTDAAGDVYIADYGAAKIYEYVHGGKNPIKTLDDSGYGPFGCAVNSKSGDLAVANYYDYQSRSRGNIAIYRHASGKGVIYADRYIEGFKSCAYDSKGNLLATDGNGYSSSYYGSHFAYLPKNAVKLVNIDFSSSGYPFYVQGIQWDGRYWVIGQYSDLDQMTISGNQATFVGTIELSGAYEDDLGPFAFYRSTPTSAPTQVVASSTFESRGAVEYWKYPAGGDDIASITSKLDSPFGVAISRKQ